MRSTFFIPACVVTAVLVGSVPLDASTETNGPDGINSTSLGILGLDGTGVTVGQVEDIRPGDPTLDLPANHNDFVQPNRVFVQQNLGVPPANMNLGTGNLFGHATQVAGVIISTDNTDPDMDGNTPIGVAPGVSLDASAYVTAGVAGYGEAVETAQFLVRGNDVPLLNHSWSKPLAPGFNADGNTILTQGMDWLAQTEDVLNVMSGFQTDSTGPVPLDHFNGITVGRSIKEGGTYRRVSNFNSYTFDMGTSRTFTDLIAPGDDVLLSGMGNTQVTSNGTSWAAPHATGTAALLHQHANNQITNSVPGWDADAKRHQVMKAVLMNSADKLEDAGDGLRLGMSRTVLKRDGTSTWLNSDAYNATSVFAPADQIPLDLEMGAGHLNANRAFQQFNAGEHDAVTSSGTVVPQIGWDYANTEDTGSFFNEYQFTDPLPAGSFVSITLAWDRLLSLATDNGVQGAFDTGDTFEIAGDFDEGYNDLDIYLLPLGSLTIDDAVARSISGNNLEHVFFQIPTTGMYEFWVYEFDNPLFSQGTDYAVAWWAFDGPPGPMLGNGDYDGSGTVDAGDYTAWKNAFGTSVTPGTGADGNGDGIVNIADYTLWRDNLGATVAAAVSDVSAVPVPSTVIVCVLALSLTPAMARRFT